MPKYLVHGSYVGDGIAGLMKDGGTGRRDAVRKLVESVGGSLECIYYAFGDSDVYVIADLPDNETAAAISLITNGSGAVSVRTTVLLTPEQMDAAAKRSPTYRKPGG